jgi:dihydroorotase
MSAAIGSGGSGRVLLRGGRVVDAGTAAATAGGTGDGTGTGDGPGADLGREREHGLRADVAIGADGRIAAVGPDLAAGPGDLVLDAGGCLVLPGLVDLHAHLREPGGEEAETVATAARAAALGGFTCVVAMPDTDPPIDSAGVAREVLDLGRGAPCDVRVAGAITQGRAGERLAPMAELAELGVRLFTDDHRGVQDPRLMRRALEYARGLGVTLAQRCDDEALSAGGHMHEGAVSARLGIPGQPAEAEELMVVRDIALARLTGARVHFQSLSTGGSLAMVRAARAGGLPVSCEVTPHHFTLTDECCTDFDPVWKTQPPLRTGADVAAVRAALADGGVDCIATDHSPHPPEEKERPFDDAPAGALGLETALALALTHLDVGPARVAALLSANPAVIAGVADEHGGPIAVGRPANLCVVDPTEAWVVDVHRLASRSRNTPFAGATLTGRVRHTLLRGEPVVRDGEAQR